MRSNYYTSRKYTLLVGIVIIFLQINLLGCSDPLVDDLSKEELFSLGIGKMEDQIDLFQLDGMPFQKDNYIVMVNGIFFISNGSSNKIMEFTSYGDLLSLFYNPEENPEPVLLKKEKDVETIVNKRAYPFPFLQVGDIAVNEDKVLYVEDMLPDERSIYDEELDVILNRIIRRFSSQGETLGYIGQEGIGGTPFPFIEAIYTTSKGELVVLSRTIESWLAFWYSEAGDLLYSTVIDLNRLPIPEEGVIPSLETIIPDPEQHRLYLKLDYYRESVDENTGGKYGIETLLSRIYWINLESGEYEDFITIPENVQRLESPDFLNSEKVEFLYQFLGAAKNDQLFLLSREGENRNQLLIINTAGKVVRRKYLNIQDAGLISKQFFLSPEGILCALLSWEHTVQVVWWRTDKLIKVH